MDERKLVEKVLKGEERAKFDLYQAHKQKLYSFCVYMMGANDPEIEDILQEVFLTAFQKLSQFEFRSSLNTWLTQICIHQCYRHFRRKGRLVAQEQASLEGLLRMKAIESADQNSRAEEQKEKNEIVRSALGRMGGPCRQILELRSQTGASYIEIARVLKVPIGTVMSRLARCTADLKELVKRMINEGWK
ncbi:MAG TPA: RNA polymerase sigma factor [bacterium]|nr:RNA polymerase sigma factor [bacterium]